MGTARNSISCKDIRDRRDHVCRSQELQIPAQHGPPLSPEVAGLRRFYNPGVRAQAGVRGQTLDLKLGAQATGPGSDPGLETRRTGRRPGSDPGLETRRTGRRPGSDPGLETIHKARVTPPWRKRELTVSPGILVVLRRIEAGLRGRPTSCWCQTLDLIQYTRGQTPIWGARDGVRPRSGLGR
jgi:hypothetical protein